LLALGLGVVTGVAADIQVLPVEESFDEYLRRARIPA
jgi:hypothetical protein